ncbi:hypothetical protein GQ53DRAFT_863479 [Thozetella sp. PMI_491]|nr:hypothetical protein GQ53DRAFT_863479 [Thozetella sp. PMI_491]
MAFRILFLIATLVLGSLASSLPDADFLTVADLLNASPLEVNSSIATQHGGFEHSHGRLAKRITQQCGARDWATLEAAWRQAIAMVLKDPTQGYYRLKSTESRVQWNTYCAIFGGFQDWPLKADQVQSMLPAAQYVAIQCNDNWLSPTDPKGKTNPNPNHFWDSRPSRPNLVKNGWIDVGPDGKCTADDMGFTIAQMWKADWDVITYCPNMFNTWNAQQDSGETLSGECAAAKPSGYQIDVLVKDKLARTVVHELMHSVNAVGETMTDSNGDTQTPIGKFPRQEPIFQTLCFRSQPNLASSH